VGRALDAGAVHARWRSDGDHGCVVRFFAFICLLMLTSTVAATDANARSCGRPADRDNPMVWSEGFGASQCRVQRPRYHTRDYDHEAARGYAAASDPMVWSDAQWRSTLMEGYSRSYDSRYDRRFRREHAARSHARIERRIEVTIRQDGAMSAPDAKARGPKLLNVRTTGEFKTNPGVLRFGGHDCRGVLVLTWGSLGSKARCYGNDGRIKRR
jgi:hypothetical protein